VKLSPKKRNHSSNRTINSYFERLQIASSAFNEMGLVEIVIPSSVEVVGEECFSQCGSLCSVTFQSGPRLSRIETWALRELV
jgi:hypothetical protein